MPRRTTPLTADQLAAEKRRLHGIIHANQRVTSPTYDPQAATAGLKGTAWAALLHEVDPAGTMAPARRQQAARALRAARLAEGRLAKLERRAPRKITPTGIEEAQQP